MVTAKEVFDNAAVGITALVGEPDRAIIAASALSAAGVGSFTFAGEKFAVDKLQALKSSLAGATVVCTAAAATIVEALHAIETLTFDVALIDINLDGEDGLIVANALKAQRMPYIITSGYDAGGIAPGHPDAPILSKPYAIAALEAAICRSIT